MLKPPSASEMNSLDEMEGYVTLKAAIAAQLQRSSPVVLSSGNAVQQLRAMTQSTFVDAVLAKFQQEACAEGVQSAAHTASRTSLSERVEALLRSFSFPLPKSSGMSPPLAKVTPQHTPKYGATCHRPPQVLEAEVEATVCSLTAAQRASLEEEFTVQEDGFELLSEEDEVRDSAPQTPRGQTATVVKAETRRPEEPTLGATEPTTTVATPPLSENQSPVDSPLVPAGEGDSSSLLPCTVTVEYMRVWPATPPAITVGPILEAAPVSADTSSTQSFEAFSRMVLQRGPCGGSVGPLEDESLTFPRHSRTESADTNLPSPVTAATQEALEARTESVAVVPKAAQMAAASAAQRRTKAVQHFIRERVRSVLLANAVRKEVEERLTAQVHAEAARCIASVASFSADALNDLLQVTQALEELLHSLQQLERREVISRVGDCTQYLCVPRHATRCASLSCSVRFCATIKQVQCGRCGQYYCPPCTTECGVGPPVATQDGFVQLGWESLCRTCWQTCEQHQRQIAGQLQRETFFTATAPNHSPRRSSAECTEEVMGGDGLAPMTLREAVLFGAYCEDHRSLRDGLAPFYVVVADGAHNSFWEVLSYRYAQLTGRFFCGLQSAGETGSKALLLAKQLAISAARDAQRRITSTHHNDTS